MDQAKTLTARASRVRNDFIRIPALLLLFPGSMLSYILRALMPVRWGGHPHKSRLLCADFYTMGIDLYLAGMRGDFLDED